MLRHDVRNSRFSPGRGELAAPTTRWRVRIGGQASQMLAADVTLDGRDDVVAIVAGSVSARRRTGALLWKTAALGATRVVAVVDLTGDGLAEVVVQAAREVRLLSALSGAEVWRSPNGSFDRLSFAAVADFNGDGVMDLALANDGGFNQGASGETHVFGFVGGAKKRFTTAKKDPYGSVIHGRSQLLADMDGDGLVDIIHSNRDGAGKGWVYVFSGKTGALVAKSAQIDALVCHRKIGLTGSRLACLTQRRDGKAGPGLTVFARQGDTLKEAWSGTLPGPEGSRLQWLGSYDFDGDGKREILLYGRTAGLLALDEDKGSLLGKTFWQPNLGKISDDVVAMSRTMGGAVIVLRSSAGDATKPTATFVLTWTRAGGFQVRANLGVGIFVTPRLLPSTKQRPPVAGALSFGGANFVWLQDTDGDGLLDQAQTRRLQVVGAKKTVSNTAFGTMAYDALGGGLFWLKDGSSGALGLRSAGDRVAVRAMSGKLLNDDNGDGRGDLAYGGNLRAHVRVGRLRQADVTARIWLGLRGRSLMLDPTTAGPGQPPKVAEVLRAGVDPMVVWPVDGNGDGDRHALVLHRLVGKPIRLSARLPTKNSGQVTWSTAWSWSASALNLRLSGRLGLVAAVVRSPSHSGEDLLLGLRHAGAYIKGGLRLINAKTGKSAWKPTTAAIAEDGYSQPLALLQSKKETTILQSIYLSRLHYGLKGGSALAKFTAKEPRYGIVKVVAEPNANGRFSTVPGASSVVIPFADTAAVAGKIFIGGGANGIGLEQASDHTSIWQLLGAQWQDQPTVVLTLKKTTVFATLIKGAARVELREMATGKLRWSRTYGDGKVLSGGSGTTTLAGLVGVRDLSGDDRPALLFTSARGWLYAVDVATGAVRWARDFGGTLGMPIPADVDGDGAVEIVITTPDGYLEVLDTNPLGSIAWVRDNAGSGPALSAAADIDSQGASDVLHANWAALVGAKVYSVRVVSAAGATIVPWTDVGATTATSLTGLNLQLGVTYRMQVRAYSDLPGKVGFSQVTQSDGVTIVDVEKPKIQQLRVDPAALTSDHNGTTFLLTATDSTRLANVVCTVRGVDGAGAPGAVEGQVKQQLAERRATLALVWSGRVTTAGPGVGPRAGPGRKRVTCRATDVAGNFSEAQAGFVICVAGEVVWQGGCVDADAVPAVDAGSTGGDGAGGNESGGNESGGDGAGGILRGERLGDGCGCAVRGGGDVPPRPTTLLLALLCVALIYQKRRRAPTAA